jgi:hypothetical protein
MGCRVGQRILLLRAPKLQEKPLALKREHPEIQNMKFLYFFLLLWVIFALLDPNPDPATQMNADPDPQPCQKVLFSYNFRGIDQ